MQKFIILILTVLLSINNLSIAPIITENTIETPLAVSEFEYSEAPQKIKNIKKSRGPIPVVKKKNIIKTDDILFIGNSLIYGIDSVTDEHTFISKIGITIKGLREDGYYENLQSHSLDTVIIEVGTNELGWFGENNFKDEFDILINKIKTQNYKSNIILMTIPPVSENRDLTDEYFNNKNVEKYNQYIKDVATKYNLMLIDVHEILGDVLSPYDTDDGIHLRGHKYEEWYQFILDKIEETNKQQ